MATKTLFQILLRNRDGIKQGITKVQDIVTEYLSTTGARAISPDERFTINKEFSELAPSNVVGDIFGDFQGLQDDAADAVMDTPFTNKVREQNPDVEIRGNETFGELMDKMRKSPFDEAAMAKNKSDMAKKQGLGSLYPRGEPGEIFDIQNDKRREVAEFMKEMRKAGIQNEDVMNTAKITDVAEGKRAATTLARAADMGADTKIKQEILSELDDDIANYGPDWWRGMGYNEGPMGRESVGNLLENLTTTVNNGIYDDLLQRGVPEEKVDEVFTYIARIRDNVKYDPKALLRKIADDVEMEDIKYDTTFWDNYIDEILTRIQKPEPRFAAGGLV